MRILQIAPVPREMGGINTGGVNTHAWGLATSLAKAGHQVAVLADNRPYDGPEPEFFEGVAVYGGRSFRGPRRPRRLARPSAMLAAVRAKRAVGPVLKAKWIANAVGVCSEVVDHFRPDVVHVHALEGRFTVATAVTRGRVPLVATAHSTHYVEYAMDHVKADHERLLLRNLASARDVIFVSQWDAARYDNVFPHTLDHARRYVLPNPIDASAYAPVPRGPARERLGIAADEAFLLSVGNLIPRKDQGNFIGMAALLKEAGVPFKAVLIGEGPEKDKLVALLDELKARDVLTMAGHVPQEEMCDYYSAADVFVFPSTMETWGLAAVEAMLCGAPIVGTFGVMPEVVPPSCGIYIDSHDSRDLAQAVRTALDTEWDRDAIRQHALGFDWGKQIGGFVEVYEKAISAF